MLMGKITYRIKCTMDCPRCGGIGIRENAKWREYHAETRDRPPSIDEEFQLLEWWSARDGVTYTSLRQLPPEDKFCDRCDGTGRIEFEADLINALRELLPQLDPTLPAVDRPEVGGC